MASFIIQIIFMLILFIISVTVIVVGGILTFIYRYLKNGSKKTTTVNAVIKPDTTGYKIFRKYNREVLAICGENITIEDIKKTAAHNGFGSFKVYVKGNEKNEQLKFPIERDVYIYFIGGYRILKKSDGQFLSQHDKNITIGDIKKTAARNGFGSFKVYVKGEKKVVFPVKRDVYIGV